MSEKKLLEVEQIVTQARKRMLRCYEKRTWDEVREKRCSGCKVPCRPLRKLIRRSFVLWLRVHAEQN